jgi:hypothetical protein
VRTYPGLSRIGRVHGRGKAAPEVRSSLVGDAVGLPKEDGFGEHT